MRALLPLLLLAACGDKREPDSRITREYRELWDARAPALVRTPCPDLEAKQARMGAFVELAADASKVWAKYDEPLPPQLAERLAAVDPGPSVADDLRCLVQQPATPGRGWTFLSVGPALLVHKGEQLVIAGNPDGWTWIGEALRTYRDAPPQVYIHFFQPAWVLERATALARNHPPPPAQRDALAAAARESVMPAATLCAGLEEELLAHGASSFYGHVTELRTAFIERWGPELAELYNPDFARRSLPSYAAWQAYRALWQPVAVQCPTMSTAELRAATTPLLARLEPQSRHAAQLLQVALSRTGDYDRLQAAASVFQGQLTQ